MTFSASGDTLWFVRQAGGRCEVHALAMETRAIAARAALPFCPQALRPAGEAVVALGEGGAMRLDREGGAFPLDEAALDVRADGSVLTRTAEGVGFPAGLEASAGGEVVAARFLPGTDDAVAVVQGADGQSLVRLAAGKAPRQLAGPFAAIDSFDLDPDGLEAVLAAVVEGGHSDVGLVSTEGSPVRWIAPQPGDDHSVSWAPRGNKITYVIDSIGGDVLRTVHIPTGFQLAVPFPGATTGALAWHPAAERFAVTVDSVEAAPRIDWVRYGGEGEETLVAPEARIEGDLDVLGGVPGGVVVPPTGLRYNERRPAVVWLLPDGPAWNGGVATVQNLGGGSVVVPSRLVSGRESALAASVRSLVWVDPARIALVSEGDATSVAAAFGGAVTVFPGSLPGAAEGRGTRIGGSVDGAVGEWLERNLRGSGANERD